MNKQTQPESPLLCSECGHAGKVNTVTGLCAYYTPDDVDVDGDIYGRFCDHKCVFPDSEKQSQETDVTHYDPLPSQASPGKSLERIWVGQTSLDIARRNGSSTFYMERADGLIDIEFRRVQPSAEDNLQTVINQAIWEALREFRGILNEFQRSEICRDAMERLTETGVTAPPARVQPTIDFSCRVCGVICDIAPDPPARAVCPEHCEDHDYRYERELRGHYCFHCGQEAPQDWGDD